VQENTVFTETCHNYWSHNKRLQGFFGISGLEFVCIEYSQLLSSQDLL